MQKLANHNIRIIMASIAIGIASRLLPHWPNVTATLALGLFAGSYLPLRLSFIAPLAAQFIADIALASIYHYPVLGFWSLFSYTGILLIVGLGVRLKQRFKLKKLLGYTITATVGYWLWTNLGTWLSGELYPLNFSGLLTCYSMALPFLRNAMLGNLAWAIVIFMSVNFEQTRLVTFSASLKKLH